MKKEIEKKIEDERIAKEIIDNALKMTKEKELKVHKLMRKIKELEEIK